MTNHTIKTINVHQLKEKMDNNPNLHLIDVREHHEWQFIHIPGAIHIPKDQISEKVQEYFTDKTAAIYIHCRSGVRSLYAADCMIELGYQDVYSVNGGIQDWAMSGYPVENG